MERGKLTLHENLLFFLEFVDYDVVAGHVEQRAVILNQEQGILQGSVYTEKVSGAHRDALVRK